jgi:nicotinamide-nucleotide amidase
MDLKEQILDLSRQSGIAPLSPWFDRRLDAGIAAGVFLPEDELSRVAGQLCQDLVDYRVQTGVGIAVLGMSGGVDSALTAALLKRAGWRVIGFTLPIEQNPEETERGTEACAALGLEHRHLDLTEQYAIMIAGLGRLDDALVTGGTEAERIRRGNVRARLRMITLYDQAHRFGGLVASTDNFSELTAGFWTLHGDVGDLAPVQSLLKSWEVPALARALGVPERTWRAKPTDGLGIGEGDEAQIGASYLEWDLMVLALIEALADAEEAGRAAVEEMLRIGGDGHARRVLDVTLRRLGGTWYKRINPIKLDHPVDNRFTPLAALDARLFHPAVLRRARANF